MEAALTQSLETQVISQPDWLAGFSRWLAEGRSEKTVASYLLDLRVYMRWYQATNGQPFQVADLTSYDLRVWRRDTFTAEKRSPDTWNRRLATMRTLARWAQDTGQLAYDPTKGIERMEPVPSRPRGFKPKDIHRLMRYLEVETHRSQTAYGHRQAVRDQAVCALMIFAGLREGEVSALQFSDLQISERKGKVIVRWGKRGKYREVPLNAEARRAIQPWLVLRKASDPNAPVFTGKRSEKLGVRGIQGLVSDVGKAIGMTITPHDFRHTFDRMMRINQVEVRTRQKLMGHARVETTLRYGEPDWEEFEEAVEGICGN